MQNNMGHATETGLPVRSANTSRLGEEAVYWFGTPSKQTLQVTKPSQWQRKIARTDENWFTQVVKQSSSGATSLLAGGNLFA